MKSSFSYSFIQGSEEHWFVIIPWRSNENEQFSGQPFLPIRANGPTHKHNKHNGKRNLSKPMISTKPSGIFLIKSTSHDAVSTYFCHFRTTHKWAQAKDPVFLVNSWLGSNNTFQSTWQKRRMENLLSLTNRCPLMTVICLPGFALTVTSLRQHSHQTSSRRLMQV